MATRTFLDTNLIVYAFDQDGGPKRERALDVLSGAAPNLGELVVSTQVLKEFFVTVTRKLARPLAETDAEEATLQLSRLRVVPEDADLVLAAIATSRRHRLSLWDAMILEAAARAGCDQVLTEDLQDDFVFRSLRVVNPFLVPR